MASGGLLQKVIDHQRTDTLASRMRQKRGEFFRNLVSQAKRPLKILDVGGTQTVWERIGFADQEDIQITLLNVVPVPADHFNMESLIGDACSMDRFADKQFDIVFSNSVIEHVGGVKATKAMADEIRRVGKSYYVQTPNRFFPVEPHFVFPAFQFLPISVRAMLVHHFALGWYPKLTDKQVALDAVKAIRLLTKSEMRSLFPDAVLLDEKLFGLSKSIQAYHFIDDASRQLSAAVLPQRAEAVGVPVQ